MIVLGPKVYKINMTFVRTCSFHTIFQGRGVTPWLERGLLRLSLAAMRVQTPSEAGFQKNIMFPHPQCWEFASMFVSLDNVLDPHILHLTQV